MLLLGLIVWAIRIALTTVWLAIVFVVFYFVPFGIFEPLDTNNFLEFFAPFAMAGVCTSLALRYEIKKWKRVIPSSQLAWRAIPLAMAAFVGVPMFNPTWNEGLTLSVQIILALGCGLGYFAIGRLTEANWEKLVGRSDAPVPDPSPQDSH